MSVAHAAGPQPGMSRRRRPHWSSSSVCVTLERSKSQPKPRFDVQNVQAGGLEWLVASYELGDEHLRGGAVLLRHVVVGDRQELLFDGSEQVESGLDLRLGVVRLHSGGHHGHEPALEPPPGACTTRARDVRVPVDLLLR